jgi:hypothetical protein
MKKENSELLLDGLNLAVEWASTADLGDLADHLAEMYQLAGQVAFELEVEKEKEKEIKSVTI